MVGDRPSIIFASRSGTSQNDALTHPAPLVLLPLVVFIGLCRILFRAAFRYDPRGRPRRSAPSERDAARKPACPWSARSCAPR
ncbi:hypothetical protein ACTMTJ_38315 [Phytohabitans sp. LJ34]|uniref:hypothetical protein n=1 Tax=Phytohabitans sp. LJ34 TaxID=3452217 RepID=UPI003F8C08CF